MSECCYKVWQWKNNSCQTKRALQSASCSFSPAGLCQNECGILNWTIHHISRVFQLMTLQSDRWRVIRKELCISIPINSLSNSSGKTWPEREEKRKFHPAGEILGVLKPRWTRLGVTPSPAQSRNHTGFVFYRLKAAQSLLQPGIFCCWVFSREGEPGFVAGCSGVSQGRMCSLVLQGTGNN